MKKKTIILPEKRFENASTEDLVTQVDFEQQERLLMNDDRDIVLDVAQLFNQERNNSIRYKLYGKIKVIFRNMYASIIEPEYGPLGETLSLISDGSDANFNGYLPYDEFAFLRTDVFRETTPDLSFSSLSSFTGFTVTVTGKTSHIPITPNEAPFHNWNLYLTYVVDQDGGYPMQYTLSGTTTPFSFLSGDGILFRVVDGGGNMYSLISPVPHNMAEGEYVTIGGTTYYINSIGNEFYDSEHYVINILKSQVNTGATFNSIVTGKRCRDINNIEGTTSSYYVHQLKVLNTVDGYIIDKSGFESTVFRDEKKLLFENTSGLQDVVVERNRMEALLYDIKEPFALSGITNNLNYTPTEIYVSAIFRNGNGYFHYPPKVGFSFNFHDSWIDQHFSGSTSNETSLTSTSFTVSGFTFLTGNTLSPGDFLTGAFVEYSPTEMKEFIISESLYKLTNDPNIFNYGQEEPTSYYGASANNPFGLFYQPHYRVKLRELSPYVETSNSPDIFNLPQNAQYFPDEKLWKWRDLYDHGYIDDLGYGTDYPFLNNTHYVKTDINFYLKNEILFTNKANGIVDFNKYRNAYNLKNLKNDKNNTNSLFNC